MPSAFKKQIHVALDPEVHLGLKRIAFEHKLSMNAIIEHLSFLLVDDDWYLRERINELKHQKREKKTYSYHGIDSDSLFDLIEGQYQSGED